MTLTHADIITSLTREEKVSLLSGANFWNTKAIPHAGVPSMMLTDGPHGLRKQAGKADHLGLNKSVPATCFPTAAALASSWDAALVEQVGQAIGREAAANRVNVVLGPGLNIVRDPLAGRAFEYFSEDPFVSGGLAAAMVVGLQQTGVAATPKHFAVNSQEHLRMSINEVVDERTLHEIYLEGFRRVVTEARPKMMMTSYNKINGTYANEHSELLQLVLRERWGYDGALVTDWGGNHDPVAGVRVGGVLEMPSSHGLAEADILQALADGTLAEATVDQAIDRLLSVTMTTSAALKQAPVVDYDQHHQLAVDAAARSLVLLKNDTALLPLQQGTTVALIGDFAKMPRYQGAGSSLVNPTKLISLHEALSRDLDVTMVGYAPGFHRTGRRSQRRLRQAVRLAQRADVAVVCLGLDEAREAEGIDRSTMALPDNQLELIWALAAVHQKVVVILAAGGPVEVPFADDVSAIVHGSLAGQAVGTALVDIITGRRNPSGKLAVSWPLTYQDAPTAAYFPGRERTAEHREGLYVGYRYYETANIPVRYPFGYGLSYTKFTYGDVVATKDGVSCAVTNTGTVIGEEIVQVYVAPPIGGVYRPVRELRGFAKITISPGETKQVHVPFDEHTFAYYDVATHDWLTETGDYMVEIGASVRDIRLTTTVSVAGMAPQTVQPDLPSYQAGTITHVSDDEFQRLLGRPLPSATWDRTASLGYDDTIRQLQYGGWRGRLLVGALGGARRLLFLLGRPYAANNIVFLLNMPFSKIPMFTGGKLSAGRIRRWLGIR